MQLSSVAGQKNAKQGFLSYYHTGKLPHAILMEGKDGYGGLALAIAFAQFLLCEDKRDEGGACQNCSACRKVEGLVHPDLHITFPTIVTKPGTKALSRNLLPEFRTFVKEHPYGSDFDWLQFIHAENKQGNITADECREIIDQLSLTAFEGGYKIQIIWHPEYLGKEGNILLKLIEEPTPNTLFFFIAEDVNDVLETIVSRTQRISLHPISETEIATQLEQQFQLSPIQATQISAIAEGNFGNAINLIHRASADHFELLRAWFNGVFTFNSSLIAKWVAEIAVMGREQQKGFLTYAQQVLGFVLRIGLLPEYITPLSTDEANFAHKLAQRNFQPETIELMNNALNDAIYHIERNANPKIVLLNLSIEFQYFIKGLKLEII